MKVQLPLAALMLGAATAFSVAATVNPPLAGAIVCGGIGSDERRALEEETRGTNLSMEFFVANRRAYVAGVEVAITPLDGAEAGRRIDVTADGPLCFVKVAPGRYRIDAELNGFTRSARTTVPDRPAHQAHVALAFPAAAVRGDLDTQPTPEEREEARTP
jgi:hypothetical protein